MKRIARLCGALTLGTASLLASGVLPAKGLLPDPPNPCFSGTRLCPPGIVVCITPVGACPDNGTCHAVKFTDDDTGETFFYCLCEGPGVVPDPRNQPNWDCGVAGRVDSNGNRTAVCLNSANCSPTQACTLYQDSNNCFFCSCN